MVARTCLPPERGGGFLSSIRLLVYEPAGGVFAAPDLKKLIVGGIELEVTRMM